MNIKRTVSMLLVMLMLITAMPVAVFAAEQLYAPTVTLASDYANGGLVFTIGERNPEGVQYYIVKVYNKNADPTKDEPVYEANFYTTSGKIAITTTSAPTGVVAGNEYFITVAINANAGYDAPAAVRSETVKAVNKMYDYDIDSASYIDLDYSEGQILDLSGLKVKVYSDRNDKTGTVINYPDPAITVYVGNEEVSGSYVLNAEDHNNAKVTMSFTGSTKTVTIGTLRVRIKLATPSITAKPDFAKGGIAYTITDTNSASNYDGFFIDMGADGFVKVTDKVGVIYYGTDLGTGKTLQSMKQYDLRVYTIAKETYSNSGKWYANSSYSDYVEDVYAVNQLKELILVAPPSEENMTYDSASDAVFKADGLSIKFKFVDNSESQTFVYAGDYSDEEDADYGKDANFEAFGVTVTPTPGTEISTALNGKQVTVSVGGKSVTTEEKIAVQGALAKPTIKLEPDYANGGLKYTITCADKDLVGSYTISLKQNKTTVATITTETLTGTLPLKDKNYKTDGELTIGVEYNVTVVANPKKDDTINKKSATSDASSAKAAFKIEDIAVYGKPVKTTYLVGEKIDYTGLTVNLFYTEIVDDEEVKTSRLITFEQFADYGVTITPANGAAATKNATTVTVKLGDMTDTFNIAVGTKNVIDFEIKKAPTKVSYSEGEKLNLKGLEVYIKYSDGNEETLEYDFADFTMRGITTNPSTSVALKVTDEEVVVTCGSESDTFSITVKASDKAVTKIEITSTPNKLVYDVNDTLDLDGLELTLTLKNGSRVTGVRYDAFEDYGLEVDPKTSTRLVKSDNVVRVYYSDSVYADFSIVVGESTIKSLTVKTKPTKTSYVAGESPDYTGLVVRAYFDSSKSVYVDVPYVDFAKYNLKVTPDSDGVTKYALTVEDTSVLIYYGTLNQTDVSKNIYTTFDITVKARTIVSMEVYSQPTLVYQAGDKLDLTNFVVKVFYTADKKDFDIVTHEMFKSFDITCTPANGTVLSAETHNGTKVKAVVGNLYVETNALTVTGKAVSAIAVKNAPTKLEYNAGEKLSLEGLKLELTYVDGTKKELTYDVLKDYGVTVNYAHGMTLSATHNDKYIQFTVKNSDGTEKRATVPTALTVVERAITELTVLKYEDTYAAGDSFDKDSLVILAKYENGSTGYIDVANVIVDPRAGLSTTDTSVTLYYGSITKELDVYVYDLEIYNMIKDWNGSKYTDVKKGQWFYPYMAYMSAVGAIEATNAAGTTLGPADLVTRAMFVEMLYRIEGSPNVKVTGRFVDIPENASYLKAAEWAYAAGITTGTSATAFSPNNTVTREQMVTFLYRYAQYKGCDLSSASSVKSYPDYKTITGYNDGKDSYGFVKAFEWAIAEGIINGASNAGVITLNPQGIAMRCEAAKILTVFHIKFIAE